MVYLMRNPSKQNGRFDIDSLHCAEGLQQWLTSLQITNGKEVAWDNLAKKEEAVPQHT